MLHVCLLFSNAQYTLAENRPAPQELGNLRSVFTAVFYRSLSNGHAGKPESDQRSQPLAASADRCILVGGERDGSPRVGIQCPGIKIACVFPFLFSFNPLVVVA